MTVDQRREGGIVAVHDRQRAIERRQGGLARLDQRGPAGLRAEGGGDHAEQRLQVVQALRQRGGRRGDGLSGGDDVGPELDELCPGAAERLDQTVGRGGPGILERPGGLAQLGPQVHEALGQRAELAGEAVEGCSHSQNWAEPDSRIPRGVCQMPKSTRS